MKEIVFYSLVAVVVFSVTITTIGGADKSTVSAAYFSERPPLCGACSSVGVETLSGVITSNRHLSCDTVYRIDGKVYVTNGATLIIDPGTVLVGISYANPTEASALIITKDARIDARGSQTCPILFTSNEADPQPGDWGGVVLLGRATVNQGSAGTIEGINPSSVPPGVDITYGGSTDADSSGVMTYCRIEYAGTAIAVDNELNGLTCGGVGNKTKLDYIEVYEAYDDAFEFFGGTVNATHLAAFDPGDDAFDFDLGYTGCIQFAISILSGSGTYSANPNGIESDNDAVGSNNTPRTKPKISNMTVIGLQPRDLVLSKGLLQAAMFRRNSSYIVRNAVFMGYPTGLNLQTTGSQNDAANFSYNLIHAYDAVAIKTSPAVTPFNITASNNAGYLNANPNADIRLTDPFNYTDHDFRPELLAGCNSPAAGGANFTGAPGCWVTVTYRGAFDGSVNWLYGWARTPTVL